MVQRKLKKGKLMMIGAIAVVILFIIIAIISAIKSKENKVVEGGEVKESELLLPDTTYSDMQVTDINMQYLEENDETMISMIINNTTENTVDDENFTVTLLNEKDETLGQMPTYMQHLEPGEQYSISIVLKGDLTSTAKIVLQK